ncbi:MAG: WxcM-like domain-containing protein [Cyclobacteriaceae bacterium]|nr:WxcM-like domain-containing protein [Cyclobacteriaceae bacterium]
MEAEKTSIENCQVVDLPKIHNPAGNITPIIGEVDLPFAIERVYYLYDVPGGETRGGHAHKHLQQYLVAAGGSFDVVLFDGKDKKTISLNRPYFALHIVPGIWRELKNFSSGSICLVLASHKYEESDYIRDIHEFRNFKKL